MDLHENSETNTVTATFELPGLKKEDVSIDVQNGRLSVTGESKIASDRDENGYAVRERRYGRFARTLQLPQGVKVGISVHCVMTCSMMLTTAIIGERHQGVAGERYPYGDVPQGRSRGCAEEDRDCMICYESLAGLDCTGFPPFFQFGRIFTKHARLYR